MTLKVAKLLLSVWIGLIMLVGCGENPVSILGADKPQQLLNLEKYFGIRSQIYGGFLGSSSGHSSIELQYTFAVNLDGKILLLSYPSHMCSSSFDGKEPTVTFNKSNCGFDGDQERVKKSPGNYLMRRTESGKFIYVDSVHFSFPKEMKPKSSYNSIW